MIAGAKTMILLKAFKFVSPRPNGCSCINLITIVTYRGRATYRRIEKIAEIGLIYPQGGTEIAYKYTSVDGWLPRESVEPLKIRNISKSCNLKIRQIPTATHCISWDVWCREYSLNTMGIIAIYNEFHTFNIPGKYWLNSAGVLL